MLLGIIVLAAVALVIYLRGATQPIMRQAEIAPTDLASLQQFVGECAQKTAQDAVVYTGLRGGVAPVYSDNYLFFVGIPVHAYFGQGVASLVEENMTKSTLEYYMDNSLKSCTISFPDFQS